MCGRYRLSRRKQLIAEYFDTDNEVDWEPRYNIAPSQPVGIIRQDPSTPERHFSLARWGLIPSWATDASIGFKTINARSETVASKPAFRDSFTSRRCLLPADGVFEWSRSGKEKQPFHFGMHDGSLFVFAGLWDRWRDPGRCCHRVLLDSNHDSELVAGGHTRSNAGNSAPRELRFVARSRLQGCEGACGGSGAVRRRADEALSGEYED